MTKKPVILATPPKPINEMDDAERRAFARTLVDALYRQKAEQDKPAGTP